MSGQSNFHPRSMNNMMPRPYRVPYRGHGPNNFMPPGPNHMPVNPHIRPPFNGNFDQRFGPQINQSSGIRPNDGNRPMNPGMFGLQPGMNMPPHSSMIDNYAPTNQSKVLDPNKEYWVETSAQDGRIYYYHGKTRQSSWKLPTGENVQIIKQSEAYLLSSMEQQNSPKDLPEKEEVPDTNNNAENLNETSATSNTSTTTTTDILATDDTKPPTSLQSSPKNELIRPNMPPMHRPMFHGPPMLARLPVRHNMLPGFVQNPGVMLASGTMLPPGHPMAGIDSWKEHKTNDGRSYYYNIHTMETSWIKPAYSRIDLHNQQMMKEMQNSADAMNMSSDIDKKKLEGLDMKDQSDDKGKQRQLPVARFPVPGTPWCVVWTGDGKVFFYNPTTSLSMWERPEELKERNDVDKVISDPPHKRKLKEDETTSKETEEPLKKKLKTDEKEEADPKDSEEVKESAEDEDEDKPQISLETRMASFQDMLLERKVSAFSTWEKELHKIVFDERYKLLNPKERKQVFDQYVKTRAEVERKEKKAHLLKCREDFKALVAEVNYSAKMGFSEFASKNSKDKRFKAIEKMKERETLFNEFVKETRKRRDDESRDKAEKIKRDFFLLMEEKHVDKCSRWQRARDKLTSDTRYSAVESYQRENWWNEFCRSKTKSQAAVGSEELEKQRRTEESLRARQREVELQKAERSRKIDSERYKHRLDEAEQHFKALLVDMVRNPDQTWSDTKRQLKKDNRWDLAKLLSRDEKERHFSAHIDALNKKRKVTFKKLLEETAGIKLTTKWKEAKKLIKHDPRFAKFSSSDRKREHEYEEYQKSRFVTAKGDLRELLKESKFITHKTQAELDANSHHLRKIKSLLENDKRYLILSCIKTQRDEVIKNFIQDLSRRGPPPPPTASEPSRRGLK